MKENEQKSKAEDSSSDLNQTPPKKSSSEEMEQKLIFEAQQELQKRLAIEMARLFGQ